MSSLPKFWMNFIDMYMLLYFLEGEQYYYYTIVIINPVTVIEPKLPCSCIYVILVLEHLLIFLIECL